MSGAVDRDRDDRPDVVLGSASPRRRELLARLGVAFRVVAVDGTDVAGPIRGAAVTTAVSAVSAVPEVRARLLAEQRAVIGEGDIVVEASGGSYLDEATGTTLALHDLEIPSRFPSAVLKEAEQADARVQIDHRPRGHGCQDVPHQAIQEEARTANRKEMEALRAEREFVGVHCGLMDPFAVGMASAGRLLWLDCKDGSFEHLPIDHASIEQHERIIAAIRDGRRSTERLRSSTVGSFASCTEPIAAWISDIRQLYPSVAWW